EVGAVELARADVERQPAAEPALVPVAEHRRNLAQHPVADFGDEPGALRDRDEAVRAAQPLARMVPPEQRLGPGDLAGGEAHLRLIGERELAALDRLG